MDFFDRVKIEIKRQNTTQDWVAGKCGISFSTFRGWISKKRLPNVDQAVAIAKALGVTVEYLVTGENPVQWQPPARIANIVETLSLLSDSDLGFIRKALRAVAEQTVREKERQSHTG